PDGDADRTAGGAAGTGPGAGAGGAEAGDLVGQGADPGRRGGTIGPAVDEVFREVSMPDASRPSARNFAAWIATTCLVVAAGAGLAAADRDLVDDSPRILPIQQAPGGALDPNSFYGKDSTEGVYVRDSALALEKFALAQKMERLKEWNKSADLYQEILEKYSDRVVPSQVDSDNKIYQ